ELAAAYASADAFVYASETETMGNVILEAMASECAVVAPHAGGIPSLLSHGTTGFLYRPGNVQHAVQCTRSVLKDEDLRLRLAQAARQAVEGRGWEQSIKRVREVYAAAIHEARRSASRWAGRQRVARGITSALVCGFQSLSGDERRTGPVP